MLVLKHKQPLLESYVKGKSLERSCSCGGNSQQLSAHVAACPASPQEESEEHKWEKVVSQDKNSSINEGKMREKFLKSKQYKGYIIHHFQKADWCPATLQAIVILERLPPRFYCSACTWHGIPLWSVQVSCPSCVSVSCPPVAYSLWE